MKRCQSMQRLLLAAVLLCAALRTSTGQSGGWCQTGVRPLPNLTDHFPSNTYQYYGAADDECSSFYFTAIDTNASSTSPSVLLRVDDTLAVSLVNPQPIPSSFLATGYRYVTGMEDFNLRLFAAVTTTLPFSDISTAHSASSGAARHRSRTSASLAPNVSSVIAVLSTDNLTVLDWYPLNAPVALQSIAIDYGDSTLYACAALSVAALYHFSIDTDSRLTALPDVQLASQPPFTAIRGSALLYPGGLLLYVSWQQAKAEGQLVSTDGTLMAAAVNATAGSVLQYDVKSQAWTSLLNTSTALPVTSMADFWSTSQPGFGSMHVIDGQSMYNYDSC